MSELCDPVIGLERSMSLFESECLTADEQQVIANILLSRTNDKENDPAQSDSVSGSFSLHAPLPPKGDIYDFEMSNYEMKDEKVYTELQSAPIAPAAFDNHESQIVYHESQLKEQAQSAPHYLDTCQTPLTKLPPLHHVFPRAPLFSNVKMPLSDNFSQNVESISRTPRPQQSTSRELFRLQPICRTNTQFATSTPNPKANDTRFPAETCIGQDEPSFFSEKVSSQRGMRNYY